MKVQPINNNLKQNNPNFEARFSLIYDKRFLPKGAPEHLTKLAKSIGNASDTIVIGSGTKQVCTNGCPITPGHNMKISDRIDHVIHSYYLSEPNKKTNTAEIAVETGDKTLHGLWNTLLHDNSLKLQNYKKIYKHMLDLKDKFKPSV